MPTGPIDPNPPYATAARANAVLNGPQVGPGVLPAGTRHNPEWTYRSKGIYIFVYDYDGLFLGRL